MVGPSWVAGTQACERRADSNGVNLATGWVSVRG